MNDPRDLFERTECACESCVSACRHMPGMLAPGDLQRMFGYLQPESTEALLHGGDHVKFTDAFTSWLLDNFEASEGAVVVVRGELLRIPTIVPRLAELGCVFLDEDDRCAAHTVAPFGCSHFDSHLDRSEGDRRSKAVLLAVLADWEAGGLYSKCHLMLVHHGRVASPVAERRAAYQRDLVNAPTQN